MPGADKSWLWTQIVVIGVEPAIMRLNAGLSRQVRRHIPEIIRLVLGEIQASFSSG